MAKGGVFGCGEEGHAGGRSEQEKMKFLTEVYRESAVATPGGRAERRRKYVNFR